MSTPSGRDRRRALLFAAALSLLVVGPWASVEAHAAPTRTERAEARAAWTKGRQAVARRRWSDAAAAFRDADRLDPKVQYKLDLTRALLAQGELRAASEVLDAIDTSTGDLGASERKTADDLRSRVEKRLATIVVEVTGPEADVTLEVGDLEPEPGEAVRLDPGEHRVRAKAPGWVPMEQTVTLREGQTEAVSFRMERDPAAASEEADAGSTAVRAEEEPEDELADGSGTLLPAAVAWAAGGAGIALGSVFGVLAFQEAEKARKGCVEDLCPNDNVEALDASKNNGTASTICFAIGGAGLVTGVVLAIVYGGDDAPAADEGEVEARVRPWIGAGAIGLDGAF